MISDSQSCREDTEDEEGLGSCLILDVIRDGIGNEELELEKDLGSDESKKYQRVRRLSDAE